MTWIALLLCPSLGRVFSSPDASGQAAEEGIQGNNEAFKESNRLLRHAFTTDPANSLVLKDLSHWDYNITRYFSLYHALSVTNSGKLQV